MNKTLRDMAKTVFIVNVYRTTKNGLEFEVVAKNVSICKPVYYKEEVIKEELLKQRPELTEMLKGRGWAVEIVKWL